MRIGITGVVYALMALFLLPSCVSGREKVRGNGKLVTRTVQITNFSDVELGSGIEGARNMVGMKKCTPVFNYTQSAEETTTLQITTDENLFSLLIVRVKDDRLVIRPEDKNKVLLPTSMEINGTSKELRDLRVNGCMDFIAEGLVTTDNLNIHLSGVSTVKMDDLESKDVKVHLSGVGSIYLKGKADEGDFSVSGVGHIYAFDCPVNNLECRVSGVGGAEVNATEHLSARLSGVGSLKYKGDAEIDANASGVGKIKRVDD